MSHKFSPAFCISTFFGLGRIPWMPGTFGSIAGYLLFFILVFYAPIWGKNFNLVTMLLVFFLIITSLFIIGVIACSYYIKDNVNQDPKEVIIDEVVGQMLVLYFTTFINAHMFSAHHEVLHYLIMIFGPFVAFRFFDIIKPWPINWFDQNIKGGLGIMLDDIIAALMSVLSYSALVLVFFK